MITIGIDNGVKGAIAVIEDGRVTLHGVPTQAAKRGEAYNPPAMAALLRPYQGRAVAAVEVASAPRLARDEGTGNITSAQKIGHGHGLWIGILAALDIPHELAYPHVWKRFFGLLRQGKAASKERAAALFPAYAAELKRRRSDYAEALLIAEFGRLKFNPQPPAGAGETER